MPKCGLNVARLGHSPRSHIVVVVGPLVSPQNLQSAVATMIENCSSLDSRLCEVRGRRPQIFAARAQSSRSAATDLRSPDPILEIGGHRSSQPGPNPRPRHRCRCKPRWWARCLIFMFGAFLGKPCMGYGYFWALSSAAPTPRRSTHRIPRSPPTPMSSLSSSTAGCCISDHYDLQFESL